MRGSYLTLYARRVFSLPDLETVKNLVLRMVYDDGFIAYLNGVEVVRRGLGADESPVSFDTPASDHEAHGFEDFDIGEVAIALQKAELLADRIVALAMPANQLLGLFPVGLDRRHRCAPADDFSGRA